MGIIKWAIIVGILLPFTGMAGFLFVSMAGTTIRDARQETTWQAWGYHAAFLVVQIVAAGLFALAVYFVISTLVSA